MTNSPTLYADPDPVTREKDTILRLVPRDLFITLKLFSGDRKTSTLENVRLRLCLDRQKNRKGDFLWSTARDSVVELRKLGLVEFESAPRDRSQYERLKDMRVTMTEKGRAMLDLLQTNRNFAYDRLFKLMFDSHPYLRVIAKTLAQKDILTPVLSSYKDHVAQRYATASALVDDVSAGVFDIAPILKNVSERIRRALDDDESRFIMEGIQQIVDETRVAATSDEPTEFAKKFLSRLNDVVVPVVLRRDGMEFDYRTHRTLWQLGEEFQVWWATSAHPGFLGTIVFKTAELRISENGDTLDGISYPNTIAAVREDFLEKLHRAYSEHVQLMGNTYIPAWELRAVFCHDQRCNPGTFDRLLEEHYRGDAAWSLELEIERTRPRHEDPVVVGKRKIGTIRVVRRAS